MRELALKTAQPLSLSPHRRDHHGRHRHRQGHEPAVTTSAVCHGDGSHLASTTGPAARNLSIAAAGSQKKSWLVKSICSDPGSPKGPLCQRGIPHLVGRRGSPVRGQAPGRHQGEARPGVVALPRRAPRRCGDLRAPARQGRVAHGAEKNAPQATGSLGEAGSKGPS